MTLNDYAGHTLKRYWAPVVSSGTEMCLNVDVHLLEEQRDKLARQRNALYNAAFRAVGLWYDAFGIAINGLQNTPSEVTALHNVLRAIEQEEANGSQS